VLATWNTLFCIFTLKSPRFQRDAEVYYRGGGEGELTMGFGGLVDWWIGGCEVVGRKMFEYLAEGLAVSDT